MKLSEHFTLAEMTRSEIATRKGLSNVPSVSERMSLEALCRNILEAVRAHYGKPVRVNSGFRAAAVNAAVGGSQTSSHCYGEAADIEVDGVSNLSLARWIAGTDLPFDQLLLEFHVPGDPSSGWVHVSHKCHVARGPNRREVFTVSRDSRGKVVYTPGLPE